MLAWVHNFQNFSTNYLLESALVYSVVFLRFLKRLSMLWRLHKDWNVCNVAVAILLFHMWNYKFVTHDINHLKILLWVMRTVYC